jgi:hypothetical protein
LSPGLVEPTDLPERCPTYRQTAIICGTRAWAGQ